MLIILHSLESPLTEALGWALVHFVWQAALLALLLALLLIPLRRVSARLRYVVQCAVLALMAACPLVTWWIGTLQTVQPMATATASKPIAPSVDVAPILGPMVTSDFESDAPIMVAPAPIMSGNDIRPLPLDPASLAEPPVKRAASWTEILRRRLTPALPWLVSAWLLGVVVHSLRLLVGWRVVQRLKRLAVMPAAEAWQAKLKDLATRLSISRPVKLVETSMIEVPTVIGWLRPVILLPVSVLTCLTPQQLEAILAHELAHIHRHDYLVNLIQTAIETLLFYHPAVWWVSSLIRAEREHCCDDLALRLCNNPVTYVTALAAMEELRASPTLTIAATGGSLLSRIRRIAVGPDNVSRRSVWWGASLIVLMVIASIGLANYIASHAKRGSNPTDEQTVARPPTDATNVIPSGDPSATPDSDYPPTDFDFFQPYRNLRDEDVEKFVLDTLRTPFEPNLNASWVDGWFEVQVYSSLSMVRQQDRVVKALIKVVDRTEESDLDQRRMAMVYLGGHAPQQVLPLLVKKLESAIQVPTETFVPYHEITVLGNIGEVAHAAIPALTQLLESSDGVVREASLQAIVKIGPRSSNVMNAIAQRFGNPDEEVWSRAVYEVGRYGELAKPLGPTFVKLLDAKPKEARIWAAQALVKSGYDEVRGFDILIGDVATGESANRSLAATALAALGSQAKSMVPRLRAFENDPEVGVAESVRDAILRIEKDDRIFTHAEEAAKVAAGRKAGDEATAYLRAASEPPKQEVFADGLEFLKPYPKLHGLSLDMTEPQFLEIVKQQELKTGQTVDGGKIAHEIALSDGRGVIVQFDDNGKCCGIHRVFASFEPIKGEVIDAVTGTPIKGATVRFRFRKLPFDPHRTDKPLAEVVYRNVGRFTFELPDEVIGLREVFVERFAEHPDYQSLGETGQSLYFLSKGGHGDFVRQVKMLPGKVVTGQVLDLNGKPAQGIDVTSGRHRDGWQNGCVHKTTTDVNGRYRLVVPDSNHGRGRLYVIPNHAAAVSRAITPEFASSRFSSCGRARGYSVE